MRDNKLTLGSLFSGSGGFELAGLLCGITPIWASEVAPFSIRVTTKRLPQVKHYGDVSEIDGGRVEPVDIITFGSPCQDMSIAGKRAGLDGSRSFLFYEAIRIIKEMRCATDGRYPRYIVWENVMGAFSSNKGEDFKAVLDAICSVKDSEADIPRYEKWPNAGEIVADDYSIAWRVLDSQHWGVAQRRVRIFLVADFAGQCAGKILFESEGLSGYSTEGFKAWQRAAGATSSGTGAASICLMDQGGSRMNIFGNVSGTLRTRISGHALRVGDEAARCSEPPEKAESLNFEEEKSSTLREGVVSAIVYENHSQDTRYTGPLDVAPTVSHKYGTGGNNQPFVVKAYGISAVNSCAMLSDNPKSGIYEAETSRTIDTGGGNPVRNQGGIAVVEQCLVNPEENFVASPTCAMTNGSYMQTTENQAHTLLARDYKDPAAVAYGIGRDAFCQGQNEQFMPAISEELQPTLTANDPGAVQTGYTVRRMTPIECARLQGFPDWWCDDLGTEKPTEEEMAFWRDVFDTYARLNGKKPRSDYQIRKWLKNPYSDNEAYSMWGNGISLPVVAFVLAGIVYYSQLDGL